MWILRQVMSNVSGRLWVTGKSKGPDGRQGTSCIALSRALLPGPYMPAEYTSVGLQMYPEHECEVYFLREAAAPTCSMASGKERLCRPICELRCKYCSAWANFSLCSMMPER